MREENRLCYASYGTARHNGLFDRFGHVKSSTERERENIFPADRKCAYKYVNLSSQFHMSVRDSLHSIHCLIKQL